MIATVEGAITPGSWLVRDTAGRLHRVAGAADWRRGESVLVVEGWIVGRAGSTGAAAVYEV